MLRRCATMLLAGAAVLVCTCVLAHSAAVPDAPSTRAGPYRLQSDPTSLPGGPLTPSTSNLLDPGHPPQSISDRQDPDPAAPDGTTVVPFPASLYPALAMLLLLAILHRCGWRVA